MILDAICMTHDYRNINVPPAPDVPTRDLAVEKPQSLTGAEASGSRSHPQLG
jgi:hypothetical protein